jgi:4-hydroxy-2-oxoheptanedioate aldolase
MGHRSFSPWTFTPGVSDASLYPGDNFNTRTSNDHIVIIPQIESVKGVENAEEIAAVPGVGALMFGPGDFSIDAGLPLKLGGEPHPKLLDALGKIGAAAKNNNLPTLAYVKLSSMSISAPLARFSWVPYLYHSGSC